MTTTLTTTPAQGSAPGDVAPRPAREHPPIPTSRLVAVELRKMFDTRAGFWLTASIGILSLVATGAVIAFAPDGAITYESFATAVGVPMSVILPMIAILAITSEWSQRSGLTTFTLVPHRGRVIGTKAVAGTVVGVVGMALAMLIGALGNVVGSWAVGVDTVWNMEWSQVPLVLLANVLGMAVGFMLGVLLRSSPAAIVGYFIYSLVLPGLFAMLASLQEWFRDLQPWVDFNFAHTRLFDQAMTGEYWAQLGTASLIWLVVPLAVGLLVVRRSEVK
jgi:hypothetical protein